MYFFRVQVASWPFSKHRLKRLKKSANSFSFLISMLYGYAILLKHSKVNIDVSAHLHAGKVHVNESTKLR